MQNCQTRFVRSQLQPERLEIEELKKRVYDLEQIVGTKRVPTQVDQIYEAHKQELEKDHLGEIVAIDIDLGQIVATGRSVLETYNEAHEKLEKSNLTSEE
jgi:hypothetical protein